MPAINALPMMPGDESLRAQDREPGLLAREAEDKRLREELMSAPRGPSQEWVTGCTCPACQMAQRDARQNIAATARAVPPMIWEGDRFDPGVLSEFGGQEFRTVTGRAPSRGVDRAQLYAAAYGAAAAPPARTDLYGAVADFMVFDDVSLAPSTPPPDPPTNRIRGRYSFPIANGMQGAVRWLEPGTMQVWDAPNGGRPQWTYTQELPDGKLVDANGAGWIPD